MDAFQYVIVRHDGTIYLTSSGAVGGPRVDAAGQHFGTSFMYARLEDGPWVRCIDRSAASIAIKTMGEPSAIKAFADITGANAF